MSWVETLVNKKEEDAKENKNFLNTVLPRIFQTQIGPQG